MRRDRIYVVFLLLSVTVLIKTAPMDEQTMKYLYKYGYLTSMEYVDEWAMEKGIKKFQASFGLPQTGRLDQTTKAKMTMPRCGMSQKPQPCAYQSKEECFSTIIVKKNGDRRPKWKTNDLTYKIWNGTERFPESNLTSAFEKAVKSWTQNTNLTITKSTTKIADLNVYFVENDGYGETLAEAQEPEFGNIFLDKDEPLSLEVEYQGQIYAGWVVAHELGHALGLLHSDSEKSVMYPAYNLNALGPSLSDRNNLVAIYGGKGTLDKTMACQKTPIDALFFMNRKHYLLKGKHYWIFDKKGLQEGPFLINEMFPFETEISSVDAAFFGGDLLFLFRDRAYFKFQPRFFLGQKAIGAGFRALRPKIDAALYDFKNDEIHFFRGSQYYKFDMKKRIRQRLVIKGENISEYWKGIPEDIEAATFLESKIVLFVKNSRCYFFDVDAKKVKEEQDCAEFFKCSNND